MIYRLVLAFSLTAGIAACAGTPSADPSDAAAAADSRENGATYAGGSGAPAKPEAPQYTVVPNPYHAEIALAETKRERDRRAILAMRGEYRVDFHFQETVRLEPGYEKRDDKTTGGYEAVIVVVDTPTEIMLQHLLVSPGGHVIKHWRQDWFFEAAERFEFAADQTWARVRIDPERTAGAWTQCVYEVSDAPRYCGTGRWTHEHEASTWTSDYTWRPLPRREYTIRDDYNALGAINRHTVTPHGWTHEQDNTKALRDGAAVQKNLVREFGFNDYYNIEGIDFQPVYAYWQRTQGFWAHVRDAWEERLWAGTDALELTTGIDGMPIIEGTFELADQLPGLTEDEQVDGIEAILLKWTRPAGHKPVAARK